MTYSVGSKGNVAILQEFVAEQIGKSVVFLVEGEDGGVWSPWVTEVREHPSADGLVLTGINLFFNLFLIWLKHESLGTAVSKSVHAAVNFNIEPSK